MTSPNRHQFSGPVTVFHERRLPEKATPAGYAALIDAYRLKVPLPRTLSATGQHHRLTEAEGWRILTPRHEPDATLEGHLTFALRYEGLDLAVLKRLFLAVGPAIVEELVKAQPTGRYARRIWFLYEWLTGTQLNLQAADKGAYVQAVDPKLQWDVPGEKSQRHRVHNNLPGTPAFCPLVFRTDTVNRFVDTDLAARARAVAAQVPADILARTAAFLLLKDSKSSYVIEGERPPHDRIQRWGRAIGEAGRKPFDLDELLRLQRIVIGDERFVTLGLRQEEGFVGTHDRESRAPIPDHIDAKFKDVPDLVNGMIAFDQGAARQLNPVIAAAVLAFGFVYVHPLQDGNGRIHRYLIHHVLAERGFNPPGVIFPVSAAFLARIDEYRTTLETYSRRLLPVIEWEADQANNVSILNDTADFYRYFDATPHTEFLFDCVKQTIDVDLPAEARFLQQFDRFSKDVQAIVDMPDRILDNLHGFLRQNDGRLSKRAREKEFAALTDDEVQQIEDLYRANFADSVTS